MTAPATPRKRRKKSPPTLPTGPRTHMLGHDDKSLLWLLGELGINGLSGLFVRGGRVVYTPQIDEQGYRPPMHEDDDDGPAQVQTVTADVLVAKLPTEGYEIFRVTKGGDVFGALMPDGIARKALAAPNDAPNLRPLHGVTHSPMVRADGSILSSPGYDEQSGYLFLPDVDVPTWWQGAIDAALIERATKLILGLVAEFPWCSVHDEATYLGGMVLPLLRLVAPPPYRLLIIGAHQPGSGKTLLGECLRTVHGGVFRGELPHDEAELAKSITGILTCTTGPVVLFDNATGLVKSSRLAALFTTDKTSDRILGTTNETAMINDRLWCLTANNARLGGDLIRRSIWAMIDPGRPNPELRTGFTIPNLAEYVAENRGEILAALLLWVRAWVEAGRPVEDTPSSDSYGASTAAVRGILAVAKVAGTFDHQDTRQQQLGEDDAEWADFLEPVWAVFGTEPFTVRELLARVKSDRHSNSFNTVEDHNALAADAGMRGQLAIPLEALPGDLPERISRTSTYGSLDTSLVGKSLGNWLGNRDGRWAGDFTVRKLGKGRRGVRWQLQERERDDPPSDEQAGEGV